MVESTLQGASFSPTTMSKAVETSVFGTKVAVLVYDPSTKQWVPAKGTTKTLSRIDLYKHTDQGTFRIVGYTLDQELVINSMVGLETKYSKLSDTFHSFRDANNVMWGFNFALRAEAPRFFNMVVTAQQELLVPDPNIPDALGMRLNDKRLGTLRLARRSPPPDVQTKHTRHLSKAFNPQEIAAARAAKANADGTKTPTSQSSELVAAAEARAKRVAEKARREAEEKATKDAEAVAAHKVQEKEEQKASQEAARRQEDERISMMETAERSRNEQAGDGEERAKEQRGLQGGTVEHESGIHDSVARETIVIRPAQPKSAPAPPATQLTGDLLLLKNEILAEVRVLLEELVIARNR